jgi:hypothetical protein
MADEPNASLSDFDQENSAQTDFGQTIMDLKRELKFKDKRIEELKLELDGQRALVHEMEEHVKERDEYLENFIQVFGLVLNDNNEWTNGEANQKHDELVDKYHDLITRYNKLVRRFNNNIATVSPVGRPMVTSEAQQAQILKYHKAGKPSRWIAESMNLSRGAVMTVVGKYDGTDRTTQQRRLKLGLEPKVKDWRIASRKQLPKAATKDFEKGRKLLKEAKGLQ